MTYNNETIPVAGLQAQFGIGRTKAYELLNGGKIRARKMGVKTLIEVQSVRDYIASLPTYGEAA
jgi:hypothetical protein